MERRPRQYTDPCGIARAMNVIGERWAVLVVRELLLGPKRFSALVGGLPSISPNVLSQRLADLVERGVVVRRQLEPPTSATAYELTPVGAALEPVLLALATWGSQAAAPTGGELSADALILAMRTTFAPSPTCPSGRYVVRFPDDIVTLDVSPAGLAARRGADPAPTAVITTTPATLRATIFAGRGRTGVAAAGGLELAGDRRAARRFLASFVRPLPLGAQGSTTTTLR